MKNCNSHLINGHISQPKKCAHNTNKRVSRLIMTNTQNKSFFKLWALCIEFQFGFLLPSLMWKKLTPIAEMYFQITHFSTFPFQYLPYGILNISAINWHFFFFNIFHFAFFFLPSFIVHRWCNFDGKLNIYTTTRKMKLKSRCFIDSLITMTPTYL